MFLFVRVRASAKSFRKQCGVPPPFSTLPHRPDDIQRSNYTRITIIIYVYNTRYNRTFLLVAHDRQAAENRVSVQYTVEYR